MSQINENSPFIVAILQRYWCIHVFRSINTARGYTLGLNWEFSGCLCGYVYIFGIVQSSFTFKF